MEKTLAKLFFVGLFVFTTYACSDETTYFTAAEPKFTASQDTIELGESIQFSDISIPNKGSSIVGWEWRFGEDSLINSTEQNPTYSYSKVGNYTVRMTVLDNNKRTASATKNIVVKTPYNAIAHAAFSMSASQVNVNTSVQFTDASIPAKDATINSWLWDFGENEKSVSTQQNPTYSYTQSGSYSVKLTIVDSKGNKSSVYNDIVVLSPEDLISVKWKKAMLGAIENTVSPAMSPDGKTVYMWADQSAANAYDVVLKAYDAVTGDEKWAFNVNNALAALNENGGVRLVYASPSVGPNGDVYLAARDLKNSGAARKTFLFAVKADGTQRWAYNFGIDGNINYQTPAIDSNGKIYVGHLTNSPFEIAILNPETGAKESSIPTDLGIRSGISLDKSGNVYFCSTGDNGLFSYTYSGAKQWQFNEGFSTTGGDITIGSNGTVYTIADGATGGIISAISASGSKIWSYTLPGAAQFGGVIIGSDGVVYANGGKVVEGVPSAGIVALNSDGSLKWHYATDEDVNNCVPLVDDRGYIHFISDKGTYYVVTNEGELYGKKSLGTSSFASPVMDSLGNVFIAVQEETVSYMYNLGTGAQSFANSAWPMKGQNPQRTHLQK